jgi:hypothetical protein
MANPLQIEVSESERVELEQLQNKLASEVARHALKQVLWDFMTQFTLSSTDLLRYVGLLYD